MKAVLAIWKQAFLASPSLRYVVPIWLAGATWVTVANWPVCTLKRESLASVGTHTVAFMVAALGMTLWGPVLTALDAISPAALHLVPGIRRHAAVATLTVWLGLGLMLAVPLSVFGLPYPLVAAVSMLPLALTVSGPPYRAIFGVLTGIVLMRAAYWHSGMPALLGDVAAPTSWGLLVMACAAGAAWIVLSFRGAPQRRSRVHARSKENRRALREPRNDSLWSALLKRPRIYRLVFQRVLREAPEARALHGLGPSFHFSQALYGGALQTAMMLAFLYVLFRVALAPIFGAEVVQFEAMIPLAFYMAFVSAIQFRDTHLRELHQRRKEEALILLLPGAPAGRALNQFLMLYLLAQHVTAIACALAMLAAVMLALHQPLEAALRMGVVGFGASLLATPGLLRDYARMKPPGPAQTLLTVIGLALPLEIFIVFKPLDSSPAALALATFAVSAALTVERYRRFSEAPTPFPVGRLAA